MKSKPVIVGILGVFSPVPMVLLTALWSWFLYFYVGMEVMGYDNIPNWLDVLSFLPMLVSPCLGVFGVICGIKRCKERLAWLGIRLSVLGLAENGLLLYGMMYIGSTF